MKNLLFCNHAHHGDVFISRGLVADVISQLPNWQVQYATFCDPKIIMDIVPCIDPAISRQIWHEHYSRAIFNHDRSSIFVNTWVGAYLGEFPCGHPPYKYLHKLFGICYDTINDLVGTNLRLNADYWHYVPDFDYSKFDLTAARHFLETHKKVYLFCNGRVHSMQSSINNMQDTINAFAEKYADITFLATEKFETSRPNVVFTEDIFKLPNDLVEISYLSTKINLIVGKNSGPFSFSNTKTNLLDAKKIFVNFSHHACDTLPYGLNIAADFRHSNTVYTHYFNEIIEQAIEDELNHNQLSGLTHV